MLNRQADSEPNQPRTRQMKADVMNLHAILTEIADTAGGGELIFPSTTDMALKVRRTLEDADCSIDRLTKLVQADPLLAARVVAVANSAIYNRSGRAITDVRNAVSRVGFNILRVLATSVVVRQMRSMAPTPELKQLADRLWEHTAHVAALAQVIARRVTRVDSDMAFFTGIVHEVGGFYLISRATDYPGLLDSGSGSLFEWGEGGAAEIGRAVLRRLGTPEPVAKAIEGMWLGYLTLPPQSLADTLLLADQLAPVESPLSQLAGYGREGTDVSIDVVLDDQTLEGILRESADEVQSLIGALQA